MNTKVYWTDVRKQNSSNKIRGRKVKYRYLDKKRGVFYLRTEEYVAERLKELCGKHHMTKYRLSQLTGMSQTALANILEKGSIPTIPTIERICSVFGITVSQFFAKEGERLDLTKEQEELLDLWDMLDKKERDILVAFIRTLKKD